MNFKRLKSFTLIEVLVAASILTVGLVSVAGTFSVGIKYSSNTKQEAMAAGIMQETMESALSAGYGGIDAGIGSRVRFSENSSSPFYNFETQTDVSYVDGNLNDVAVDSGLKKIKVSVFWNNSGTEKKEEAVTLIAKQ